MSDVQIAVTGDLPESIAYAAEFGPGFIHLAIRPDANLIPIITEALTTMIDCYPPDELKRLSPSCRLAQKIA